MKIEFEAVLPDDLTKRERDALLYCLLGEMTTNQIAEYVFNHCGSSVVPIMNYLDARS